MDYLVAPFELIETKAGKDGPEFSGYVSTFGNIDAGADVVMPGAFDRTLKERAFRPLLWGHDQHLPPIGVEKSLKPDTKGLLGTWELIDTQLGTDIHKALKAGAVRSMSIGYVPVNAEYDGDVRKLIDIELLESSVVNVPMNDEAIITAVKARLAAQGDTNTTVIAPTEPTEQPYAEHAEQLLKGVAEFIERAKRRADVRAANDRSPGASFFEQLKTLRSGVDELLRLEDVPAADVPKSATSLRLAIARRRLAMAARMESAR